MNNNSNATASFGGNVWVGDANVLGTYSVGTYNLFDFAASNYSYTSSNAIISGEQIQSGQAFFVKSSTNATFSIRKLTKEVLLVMRYLELQLQLNYYVWVCKTNQYRMVGS